MAMPIVLPFNSTAPLPSSEIDKSSLVSSVEDVLKRYKDSTPVFMSGKLACEAIFGRGVLCRCTPMGASSYPALPQDELYMLKQLLLSAYPEYWGKPQEFEELWKQVIIRRLSYTCGRLRREDSIKFRGRNL